MPFFQADPQEVAAMREKMFNSQFHKFRLLAETFRGRLERYEIGGAQVVVLLALCARGDLEPAQIADVVLIPRQTITSILDKLEARGLIVRTDHPTDRRRKIICLTQAGFDEAVAIWRDVDAYESQIMEAFTPRELELFRRLSVKLAGRLAELG